MAKQIKTGQDREQRKNNFSKFFDISNQDAILPLEIGIIYILIIVKI